MGINAFRAGSSAAAIAFMFGLIACTGKTGPKGATGETGPAGTPAADIGSIAGTVKDANGSPLAGAAVSTDPATISTNTDATGAFILASIPIGAYTVIASDSGYSQGKVTDVGVGAGATVNVSLALVLTPPTTGSISGTVRGRMSSSASSPIAGASVCVQGVSPAQCVTSGSNGTYTIADVAPGFVFLSASATGFLPGENRRAVNLTAGAAATGADITLSGMPPATATFVGTTTCIGCHTDITPDIISGWQRSAHEGYTDRTLGHMDTTGWPAAATDSTCAVPNTSNTNVTATIPGSTNSGTVWLVRWATTCTPQFAMGIAAGATLNLTNDVVIRVDGTFGGVSTGAGQCGNPGIVPATSTCNKAWWQQEYLVKIGTNPPTWVTWSTFNTPDDVIVLPAAWNGRGHAWVNAPDFNPTQSGTFSNACAGCHESGISLAFDVSGMVTSYSAVSHDIGCEKCHGPGSAHVSGGGAVSKIVNPRYLTAQSERETCGQCHTNGGASTSPAGNLGFAFNSAATFGGGNFIPGVHALSDFLSVPSYGDPSIYWSNGFPSTDHTQYQDLSGSPHVMNNFEKITCADCHDSHSLIGGPFQFQRTDDKTGDVYAFKANVATLRDDVTCLSCHATHGDFSLLSLEDVALYHISSGGTVQKNGTALNADTGAAAALVASTVTSHMKTEAAMPAFFDPTGAMSGEPVGRCSSCHMAKTSNTGQFFSGQDAEGRTANIIGDVTSHTFRVAWPDTSTASWNAATTWDQVMQNACGACHADYRFCK